MPDIQRKYPRKPLEVWFHGRDTEGVGELSFQGGDLSQGGAFLRSDLLLEAGDLLALEFDLPSATRRVLTQGRIAWVRRFPKDDEPAGMGVEFLSLSDEDRRLLATALGDPS